MKKPRMTSVQRVGGRMLLCRNGYPPDRQEKATQAVLEQAEVLSEGWEERRAVSGDVPAEALLPLSGAAERKFFR